MTAPKPEVAVTREDRERNALRYVLNFAGTGTRLSTILKTFTVEGDERITTGERLESLWTRLAASTPGAIDEEAFWRIVDGEGLAAVPSDAVAALETISRKASHYDKLIYALHEAICSPKGVVPDSADAYYRSALCLPLTHPKQSTPPAAVERGEVAREEIASSRTIADHLLRHVEPGKAYDSADSRAELWALFREVIENAALSRDGGGRG